MRNIVRFETTTPDLEYLKQYAQTVEFKSGDGIKIILPRQIDAQLYSNLCYYLSSCMLSDWRNKRLEEALEIALERAFS